jgi:hypothetical protein
MPSDERSKGLATEHPVPDHEKITAERERWMTEFACIVFDMFIASGKSTAVDGARRGG